MPDAAIPDPTTRCSASPFTPDTPAPNEMTLFRTMVYPPHNTSVFFTLSSSLGKHI
jgi:hypothetical protein